MLAASSMSSDHELCTLQQSYIDPRSPTERPKVDEWYFHSEKQTIEALAHELAKSC
jgi:hypothetical protein